MLKAEEGIMKSLRRQARRNKDSKGAGEGRGEQASGSEGEV